jgi:hypothetical protein
MLGKLVSKFLKDKAESTKKEVLSTLAENDLDANGVKDGQQLLANLNEVQEGADAIGAFVDRLHAQINDPVLKAQWKEVQEAISALADTGSLAGAYFNKYGPKVRGEK